MLRRSSGERDKRGFAPGNVVSRVGPRTRFRYPGKVSGPADEEICLVDYVVGGGSRGGYRGLEESEGGCTWDGGGGDAHFAGLDRKRTRSSRRMEGWRRAAVTGLRAMTAYAVIKTAVSRSASLTACDCWELSVSLGEAMALGANWNCA